MYLGAMSAADAAGTATIAANVQRELAPINLREIIHEFIREFAPLAKRRSIDFTKPEFDGEVITGPDTRLYQVTPLPAGTYAFVCKVHPTTMIGTLTVK